MINTLKIIRAYQRAVAKDDALKKMYNRAKTYEDAQKYADGVGDIINGILSKEIDIANADADELGEVLAVAMKYPHEDAGKVARAAQKRINQASGIGLNPVSAEYQPDAVRAIAHDIAGKELEASFIKNQIVNSIKKAVDDTAKANAQAQENTGLHVRITRRYDNVGLHNGRDVCQWCLDREGEWDSYNEAVNDGAFERHPGCACVITYEVGKRRSYSIGGKWIEY